MKETLRLVRVFLASPGDLPDERRLAKEAVDEINKQLAPHLGFRVELMAWEETLPGYGRPQDIINQDLELCELFIGIMWKRWGTPPATKGPYSSGFEEEFERSYARRKETGQPEIAMYFKEVGSELIVNPGEDLNKIGQDLEKVKAFQKRLDSEKTIFFKKFQEPHDLQRCVREKITQYLLNLEKTELENREEESAKSRKPEEASGVIQDNQPVKSPFSIEGHNFLTNFLEKTKAADSAEEITPLEVARFRLLSNAISKSGNDKPDLGVHDANIIFSNRDIEYGSQEILSLIKCGLKNIFHENVPLWYWYHMYEIYGGGEYLAFSSIVFSAEDVCVGALEAMKLIGLALPDEDEFLNRKLFINKWLSNERSDSIKLGALRYLKYNGKDEDLPIIHSELDQANSKTARPSLESILGIQLRYNKGEALRIAFINQFELIDEMLLNEVLSVSSELNDEILRLGLKHRNKRIRLEGLNRLIKSKGINDDDLQDLKNDSSALIRKRVVDFMLSNDQPLSDKEIKNILIKPQKSDRPRGLLVHLQSDDKGRECYDEYLFSKFSKMTENKLLKVIKENLFFYDIPYFALCNRYFKKHGEMIRKDVDDQFKERYEYRTNQLKKSGASEEIIKGSLDLSDFVRRQLTRKGLDVLCMKGDAQDLDRIRKNMRSEYVNSSLIEIEYMRKYGEWEDIPFIVNAGITYTPGSTLLTSPIDYNWNRSIAEAIYNIGKDRLEELLNIKMPTDILIELLTICSTIKFSELPANDLFSLLNNKEEKVRKFACFKSIQSFNKSKLKSLLENYEVEQEYHYYNVLYWLDFGVSVRKSVASRALKNILNEY